MDDPQHFILPSAMMAMRSPTAEKGERIERNKEG
jgi:hypothetical protein